MEFEFILVEPEVPENIGAAARAIKTMGFNRLKLVNPVEYLSGEATWLAHGSGEILTNATVYTSLNEALEGSDFAIATTAKERWIKKEDITSREIKQYLSDRSDSINNVSVVFGREKSGLTNSEIELCDITSSVPLAVSFPSLNLAQAVMVFAYELSLLNGLGSLSENSISPEAAEKSMRVAKERVTLLLNSAGIGNEDLRFGRIMDRLSLLSSKDLNLLHTATSAIIDELISKQR